MDEKDKGVMGGVFFLTLVVGFSSYVFTDEKGLIGYWGFNEGEGEITEDSSGNRNLGRIIGAEWVKGIKGYALKFDGKDDYVDCGKSAVLNIKYNQPMTWLFWVKTTEKNHNRPILDKLNVRKHYVGWEIGSGGYGDHGLQVQGDGEKNTNRMTVMPVGKHNDGKWHHIAVVKVDENANNVSFYMDGVLQEKNPDAVLNTLHADCTSWTTFRIASTSTGEHKWKGTIDEIRIYNRALSKDEIVEAYEFIE